MGPVKLKLVKSKVARSKLERDKKIKFLRSKVKKLQSDLTTQKRELLDQIQENVEASFSFEEDIKNSTKKVENLKKHVECPICLEVPRKGPVYACPNGHFMCQGCYPYLIAKFCLICGTAMGNNKSILAVAVIDSVLHDCKFYECEEEFPLNRIEQHEKVCNYRIVACPAPDCNEKVALSKLMDHLDGTTCTRNGVPKAIIDSSGTGTFSILFSDEIQDTLSKPLLNWRILTYIHMGIHLALCVQKSGEYYLFNIVMFDTPDVCSHFNLEMEVYESSSPTGTRHSAKLRTNPCSIDQTKSEIEHLGMSVHRKVMEKLVLRENSFRFTVSFSFF